MWQYELLQTGFFHADGGSMFGIIPKLAWNRKYPAGSDNTCILAMNCLLVWNNEQVILLDTGVGTKDLGKLNYYRFHDTKNIIHLLHRQGFEPEQVTDIILSHLHFDHCGGCTFHDATGKVQISFPTARHWVSWKQWNNYLHTNDLEKKSFRMDDMLPVAKAGLLQFVEKNQWKFADNFWLYTCDGHTTGQLITLFKSNEEYCLFTGDVIPTRAHLSNEWISAYDTHPLNSLTAKRLLKQNFQNKSARLFFYHDAYNLSTQYS